MTTTPTKSLSDVLRNTHLGVTNINGFPSRGSNLSTTPSSTSMFLDDVYMPIVNDTCYNVDTKTNNGAEINKLQIYREWMDREDVNLLVRDAIQTTYKATMVETNDTGR